MSSNELHITVTRLGTRGDGIATLATGETLYIPFSAPGDRLNVSVGARRGNGRMGYIREIFEAADSRTEPVCPHFGDCGGCTLQHLQEQTIADIKKNNLIDTLRRHGLDTDIVTATVTISPGRRRRAEFALFGGKKPTLGLHAVRSQKIVNLLECAVLIPNISILLPDLRELSHSAGLGDIADDIRITETDSGIDMLLISKDSQETGPDCRQKLATFAETHNLARIGRADRYGTEPLVLRRRPTLKLGGAVLNLPERYFLQPSNDGEKVIADLIGQAIFDGANIADLYSGLCSLSFPLADKAKVTAFEFDEAMVNAANRAANGQSLSAEQRNLVRSPLTVRELDHFDAVIFDPPKAGARHQASNLARSAVPTIVAVSCNPNSMARDLRILSAGGYRIERITPVDQFTWSSELEAVAILRR